MGLVSRNDKPVKSLPDKIYKVKKILHEEN